MVKPPKEPIPSSRRIRHETQVKGPIIPKMPGVARAKPVFRWRVMIESYDEHSIIVEATTPHEASQKACELFGQVENGCGGDWTWLGGLFRSKIMTRADKKDEEPPWLDYDGSEDPDWQIEEGQGTGVEGEEGIRMPKPAAALSPRGKRPPR